MKRDPGRGSVGLLPLVVLVLAGLVMGAHCERASGSMQRDPSVRMFRTGSARAPTRPNIVFIVTDDQRADTLVHLPAVQR